MAETLNEKLIIVLGLPATASERDILDAITPMQLTLAAKRQQQSEEREISALVAESLGALTRDGAKEVLATRKRLGVK